MEGRETGFFLRRERRSSISRGSSFVSPRISDMERVISRMIGETADVGGVKWVTAAMVR